MIINIIIIVVVTVVIVLFGEYTLAFALLQNTKYIWNVACVYSRIGYTQTHSEISYKYNVFF